MKTIIFYVMALLCLVATKLNAQSFSERAAQISDNIGTITKQQKDSLKVEIEAVNLLLEDNEITTAEADKRKKEYADKRANNIETLVAIEQEKLNQLVDDKVAGKVSNETRTKIGSITITTREDNDTIKVVRSYGDKRTTSQFVFAIGVNRLVTDGKIDDSNFEWRSDYYEWGLSFNSRLAKNHNLLHLKYGLSLQYNNLRPNNNQIFVNDNGQTVLQYSGRENIDVARLRYVNLVVPMHLEFDFTKKKVVDDKTYFPSHKSFRIGLGGYVGANVKEKQIIKYENEQGQDVKERRKGDYNVSDFVYGVSAYVGYKEVSLYAKYDLQSTFSNNAIDQNTLSMGVRFDFN